MPFALREIEGGTGARRGTPTTNPVSHFQLPHPVVGAIRESPVPPQREPPIPPPSALADPRTPSPHRRGNPRGCPGPLRKSVHPEPVEGHPHGRYVGATLMVALPRTPSPSATPHPDTAPLPPRATLRYRRAVENAVQCPCQANHRATITNRFVASALCVDDQTAFAHPKGRLFTMGEKILGFVAEIDQSATNRMQVVSRRSYAERVTIFLVGCPSPRLFHGSP